MHPLTGSFGVTTPTWFINSHWLLLCRRYDSASWLLQSISSYIIKLLNQSSHFSIARALISQPNITIFDEAVSNLDQATSEQFAQTINRLKGKVTILFITHQLPKGLHVDEAILLGKDAEETSKQTDDTNLTEVNKTEENKKE